jgi:hypothetical protein
MDGTEEGVGRDMLRPFGDGGRFAVCNVSHATGGL